MQQLDDADLDLVAALQLAPRAPLNAVAEVLGSSATTVGRRIQRLQDQRLLRFISTVHWSLLLTGNPYVVWIKCEPGTTPEVAAAIQQVPEAQSILITSGDADVYCTIYPLPGTDLRHLLTRALPATPGIASIQAHLVLNTSRQAVSWHLDRLTGEQEAALREHADADPGAPPETMDPLGEAEFAVLRLLREDGRLTAAQAARELDVSRSTAYRLIQSVLEKGAARPRVEIEPAVLGYPITALLTLDVQPQHIPAVLKSLSAHPSGRFTVMTAGPAAITHHGVFRDETDLSRFITEDVGALPGINGLNMSTALGVLRRQWISRENDIHIGEKVHDILEPRSPE
ncbi:DNA-binding transcriptional regulator, Lrp family [Saccharopolyspora kobensis]|uniref:DNA-binding transcriptional regulator, Lrp family n=1 Tax=Saccharopolyspora kobensis TaxID=146035 RepID=A0A1H5SV12_9PSEU|nr:Lrp/AsnC family transcriptional regulator [Saccharopolyspora kobensis]SEF54375.1 DNA-binding transcriptional regulator, Lrp family [Saccharopolyspora kobensis]SFC53346.1 transcriptional regulator, AsnC family [Saccharopolyspora kobensis]